jgi:transposase
MARFKVVDMSPRLLPVVLEQQLAPGTFEYALHTLIDAEFDLSALEAKFKNDETGAPAYDLAVLLKIVLLAYSRGMVSSRTIERVCRESGCSWRSPGTRSQRTRRLPPLYWVSPTRSRRFSPK